VVAPVASPSIRKFARELALICPGCAAARRADESSPATSALHCAFAENGGKGKVAVASAKPPPDKLIFQNGGR